MTKLNDMIENHQISQARKLIKDIREGVGNPSLIDDLTLVLGARSGLHYYVTELLAAGAKPTTEALNTALVSNQPHFIITNLIAAGATPNEHTLDCALRGNDVPHFIITNLIAAGATLSNNTLNYALVSNQPHFIVTRLHDLGAMPNLETKNYAMRSKQPHFVVTRALNEYHKLISEHASPVKTTVVPVKTKDIVDRAGVYPSQLKLYGIRPNKVTGPRVLAALWKIQEKKNPKVNEVARQFLAWAKKHNRHVNSTVAGKIRQIASIPLINDNFDLRETAKQFPDYATVLIERVLSNEGEFKRLIKDNFDLRETAKQFPDYATVLINKFKRFYQPINAMTYNSAAYPSALKLFGVRENKVTGPRVVGALRKI